MSDPNTHKYEANRVVFYINGPTDSKVIDYFISEAQNDLGDLLDDI